MGVWDFFRDEGNQKTITWVAGCCGGLATAGVAVWNFIAPTPPVDTQDKPKPPVIATSPCADAQAIRLREGGFIFPDSHERKLELAEVLALDDCQRWIARNEIYARKGESFINPVLRAHFSGQSWFRAKDSVPKLTALEWENVRTIQKVESR